MDAIILAGGKTEGELKELTGKDQKALIELKGKPMVEYVIDGLREAKNIERIILVGAPELKEMEFAKKVNLFVEEGKDFIENMELGIKAAEKEEKVLIIAADVPLVTGASIDDFVEKTKEAQISIPSIPMEDYEKKYPGTKRTYAKFKEGRFKNGNVTILEPRLFFSHRDVVTKVFQGRKNLLALASILGFRFVLKFLAGKLTVADLEARVSEIFQAKATTPVVPYPELGFDVDKPSDLELVMKFL